MDSTILIEFHDEFVGNGQVPVRDLVDWIRSEEGRKALIPNKGIEGDFEDAKRMADKLSRR